jgi:ABC-2 type transport system permease protein
MLRSVLLKTLRDQRRGLIAWATSIVLLVMMYGSFWPSIRDQLSLKDFLDQMPAALRSMFAMSGADVLDALPGRPFRAENGAVVARRCPGVLT